MDENLNSKQPHHIFVVEDSPHDYMLLERAFSKTIDNSILKRFDNGEILIDYINNSNQQEGYLSPSLIFLDLNLPGLSGLETLEVLRKELGIKNIPMVLMSTSGQYMDVLEGYNLGANTYFMKPFTYEDYCGLVRSISEYWFSHALIALDSN